MHPLAGLLAQRMPIPRRRRFIIEPLDHEKGGSAGAPPIIEGHVPARCEMRDKDRKGQHSTRASIFGSDVGESQRAPSTVTQSLPFILTCAPVRKCVPIGVESAMRPPAASSVTLRTSSG